MDGVYEMFVGQLDMRPGCPTSVSPASAPPTGFGFWANAMTTRDARQVSDPRPVLRRLTTPVLVLRGECDYLAAEVSREYRDVLPGAVLRTIDGAGHDIEDDRAGPYQQAVTSFLIGKP
jgi:proline iminopeptidase